MTTFKEYNTTKEETMTNGEAVEMITELVGDGIKVYKKAKNRLIAKGFVVGLVTAVAIQSVSTIIVMLIAR